VKVNSPPVRSRRRCRPNPPLPRRQPPRPAPPRVCRSASLQASVGNLVEVQQLMMQSAHILHSRAIAAAFPRAQRRLPSPDPCVDAHAHAIYGTR
jgi:hypothetical protein